MPCINMASVLVQRPLSGVNTRPYATALARTFQRQTGRGDRHTKAVAGAFPAPLSNLYSDGPIPRNTRSGRIKDTAGC